MQSKEGFFHSEADFQQALAWEIHRRLPNASIRLELPILIANQTIHLDIWVTTEDAVLAIELKYKTRGLKVQLGKETFRLKSQSAQTIGRYDFIKDIQRLEQVVATREQAVGYAIFLTNDSAYWARKSQRQTVDADFRLYQGRVLEGTLRWGAGASEGTKRGREDPIALRGRYTVDWQDYSRVGDEHYGVFRYLAIETRKTEGAD